MLSLTERVFSGGPRFGTLLNFHGHLLDKRWLRLPRALMRPAHPLPRHMHAAARRKRIFFGAQLWDFAQLAWRIAQQALDWVDLEHLMRLGSLGLGHRFVTLLYFCAQLLDKHWLRLPRALSEAGWSTTDCVYLELQWGQLIDLRGTCSRHLRLLLSLAERVFSGGPRFGTLLNFHGHLLDKHWLRLPRALMRPAHPLPWHMHAAARRKRLFFDLEPKYVMGSDHHP